jgi:hypothetical protein
MNSLTELRSIDVAWPGTLWQGVIGEDHPYRHSFGGPLDLVVQKEAADQLVVVVRPDKRYGVSLWGESGDAEMVEVISACSRRLAAFQPRTNALDLADSPFTVVLELDLSQKDPLLDVVVVQRRSGKVTRPLPDGLDDLVAHNLISFKSHPVPSPPRAETETSAVALR